jgi:hypothetical protein
MKLIYKNIYIVAKSCFSFCVSLSLQRPPPPHGTLDFLSECLIKNGSSNLFDIRILMSAFHRDNLIEHLQHEISRLRAEIRRLTHEHQRIVDQLNEKIAELQVDLATKVLYLLT